MGFMNELYILNVIDQLEKAGKTSRPVDIIEHCLAEHYGERVNRGSIKSMFFKKRKYLLRDKMIIKDGSNYHLTTVGRKELLTNMDKIEKQIFNWKELSTNELVMSYADISTPYLIAERKESNKLDDIVIKMRDLLEKEGIESDYQIFIRHKRDK